MKKILLLLATLLPLSATAQVPKEFASDFGSAKLATVEPYSSAPGQDVFGTDASISCKNGNCVGASEPLSIPATAYIAIFRSGDWRIAAYCVTEFGGCSKPSAEKEAWIRSTHDGIRALFFSPAKTISQEKADKKLRSFWNFKNFWQIKYIYNAKTKDFWPRETSLREEMKR